MITNEYYRDFIGALAHKRASVNCEMKAWEHRMARGQVDYSEYWEYHELGHEFEVLTRIQEYFLEYSRWIYFADLETLKLYIKVLEVNYKTMTEYSNLMLPEDGGELVGVTQEEWDAFESERYKMSKKIQAWKYFAYFCEHGGL